ncbi:TonB-dependent receptor [Spirochaetia bacterium]|nr:TonB-dependent receptor [Spirochaetia bacterium]
MFKYGLFLLVLFTGIGLFAREVEVLILDADLEIPLEGALIRSWDGREYLCDPEGKAQVEVPDNRQVVIQAAYPGYENGRLLISANDDKVSLALRLGGVMENRELVIEAQRPKTSETKSGRSVAVSGDALSRTAEIGLFEDVMTSVKLLPGVGYSGMFNALPSIRGGDPGDLTVAMDGFYIEQPYHWGGAFSIFVPQMVESARLSHGIFSSRYGHTISGLLEITTKKPSPTESQLELGISTSETTLGVSVPFGGKGGVSAMGKVTYWDAFVWTTQQLTKDVPELDILQSITTAPFIRDFSITGNYRFSTDMELTATGFAGSDGVGAEYHNVFDRNDVRRDVNLRFDWINYTLFFIVGLTWNPRRDMVFSASLGAGLYESDLIADITINNEPIGEGADIPEDVPQRIRIDGELVNTTVNYQGRADLDWNLAPGFILAAGVQELYAQWIKTENFRTHIEMDEPSRWLMPGNRSLDVTNHGLSTAAYTLLEYSGSSRFGAELGLRLDHFYFIGDPATGGNFTLQTMPVFNPRLNIDFQVLKNFRVIDSFTLTAGTGLFSSMNDAISSIDISNNLADFDLKPNRSWTSLLGAKIDFSGGISFNIEGYYKHIFDRAYTVDTISLAASAPGTPSSSADYNSTINYWFNGTGRIVGFDFHLQKMDSRYFDGWLSYSFVWAQYRNPNAKPDPRIPEQADSGRYPQNGNHWYYPDFHRYHNINLVMNIKPFRSFNIGLRFGFASGTPETGDNRERTGFSWPVDVKFSFFRFDPKGKVNTEIYLGVENLQSLVYDAIWIARVNGYTGEEEMSEYTPVYDLPIPMISFGFKWRY